MESVCNSIIRLSFVALASPVQEQIPAVFHPSWGDLDQGCIYKPFMGTTQGAIIATSFSEHACFAESFCHFCEKLSVVRLEESSISVPVTAAFYGAVAL